MTNSMTSILQKLQKFREDKPCLFLGELAGGVLYRPERSLSAKLLLLTILFVMLAEIMIFVPSVANYRKGWLKQKISTAQFIPLAAKATPDGMLGDDIKKQLLEKAGVYSVAVKSDNIKKLAVQTGPVPKTDLTIDLDHLSTASLIFQALYVFISPPKRILTVIGPANMMNDEQLEIVISETPLKKALYTYATNIFLLSLVISIIAAVMIFFAINRILVAPIQQLTQQIIHFSKDPEDPTRIITPSRRRDELGEAEHHLFTMQEQLQSMFKQKKRLAELGLAVSKINHDLRNMLANAQLISDHLGTIENPAVQRLTPRLINSVDRAIRLCTQTLKYGKNPEARPILRTFPLKPLVEEVMETLDISKHPAIKSRMHVDTDLHVTADRDQLFRALSNLSGNAAQALAAQLEHAKKNGTPPPDTLEIRLDATLKEDRVHITVADTGPGIPPKQQKNLFKPFQNSRTRGGTGLGLAITAEIVQSHGGTIKLDPSDTGSLFHITLPATSPTRSDDEEEG